MRARRLPALRRASTAAIDRLPERFRREPQAAAGFNRWIIDADAINVAAAYKPNLAFYEARGAAGWEELAETMAYLRIGRRLASSPSPMPSGPTSTPPTPATWPALLRRARLRRRDAAPVPRGRRAAAVPRAHDKACIVLCRTSNPGRRRAAGPAGRRRAAVGGRGLPRPRRLGRAPATACSWSGATYPDELRARPRALPRDDLPGPRRGRPGWRCRAGRARRARRDAGRGLLINASRRSSSPRTTRRRRRATCATPSAPLRAAAGGDVSAPAGAASSSSVAGGREHALCWRIRRDRPRRRAPASRRATAASARSPRLVPIAAGDIDGIVGLVPRRAPRPRRRRTGRARSPRASSMR